MLTHSKMYNFVPGDHQEVGRCESDVEEGMSKLLYFDSLCLTDRTLFYNCFHMHSMKFNSGFDIISFCSWSSRDG